MPVKSQAQRAYGWSDESRLKFSISRRGSLNPMWKGGKTVERKSHYLREWRKNNESYVRDKEYRKRFGITLEEYDVLEKIQNGLCAICHKKCNRGRLAVDHCHKTGKVRGLLCRKCNIILGLVEDDLNWLTKANEYLCPLDQTSAKTFENFTTDHVTPQT